MSIPSCTTLYGAVVHVDLRGRIRQSGIGHGRTSRLQTLKKAHGRQHQRMAPPHGRGSARQESGAHEEPGLDRDISQDWRLEDGSRTLAISCGPPDQLSRDRGTKAPTDHRRGPEMIQGRLTAVNEDCPSGYCLRLIDTMRVTPRGDGGWRFCPESLIASSFCLSSAVALEVSPLLEKKITKKSAVLAPC